MTPEILSDPIEMPVEVAHGADTRLRLWQPEVPKVLVVLAHGAESGMDHPLIQWMFWRLAKAEVAVCTFNFPYIEAKRPVPDRSPILDATMDAVIYQLRGLFVLQDLPMVLAGKSMGARVAARVAHQRDDVSGVAFLGYPLHSAGSPDAIRAESLGGLTVPTLFIQGDQDPMAQRERVQGVVDTMQPHARVVWIPSADHNLVQLSHKDHSEMQGWEAAAHSLITFLESLAEAHRAKPKRRRSRAS